MTQNHNEAKIERYWADFFGLDVSSLSDGHVRVVPHVGLQGYNGAWIFRRDKTVVISVPPDQQVAVEEMALSSEMSDPHDAWLNPSFLRRMFPLPVERTVGPAYQGFVDSRRFRGRDDATVRLATPADFDGLAQLEAACAAVEWEHSSIALSDERLYVCTRDGALVAAASAKRGDGAHPAMGLVTHPAHRGRGYAAAVASAATADALTRDPLVLWQTLVNNTGSIKIADRLGYAQFAETMAVRFK